MTEETHGCNVHTDSAGPTATAMAERALSNSTARVGGAAAASTRSSNKPVVNSVPTEKPVNAKAACMRFTPEEEIILLEEVGACGAHKAKYRSMPNQFHEAANEINTNPRLRFPVKTHAVQEKFGKW